VQLVRIPAVKATSAPMETMELWKIVAQLFMEPTMLEWNGLGIVRH